MHDTLLAPVTLRWPHGFLTANACKGSPWDNMSLLLCEDGQGHVFGVHNRESDRWCSPDVHQVEDVLLEAGAPKAHAGVQELGPNARVRACATALPW